METTEFTLGIIQVICAVVSIGLAVKIRQIRKRIKGIKKDNFRSRIFLNYLLFALATILLGLEIFELIVLDMYTLTMDILNCLMIVFWFAFCYQQRISLKEEMLNLENEKADKITSYIK